MNNHSGSFYYYYFRYYFYRTGLPEVRWKVKDKFQSVLNRGPDFNPHGFFYFYSGCQKNVPFIERFFLQPLIPAFRISELIFEKRYNIFQGQ